MVSLNPIILVLRVFDFNSFTLFVDFSEKYFKLNGLFIILSKSLCSLFDKLLEMPIESIETALWAMNLMSHIG